MTAVKAKEIVNCVTPGPPCTGSVLLVGTLPSEIEQIELDAIVAGTTMEITATLRTGSCGETVACANGEADKADDTLQQTLTFYSENGRVAKIIDRTISLMGGNTLKDVEGDFEGRIFEEDKKDKKDRKDRYTLYSYKNAFAEALRLSDAAATYDYGELLSTSDDELLSTSRLLKVEGNKLTIEIKDLVNGLILRKEIDNLNKVYRIEKANLKNGIYSPYRIIKHHFDDALMTGFGVAKFSITHDVKTGIYISESEALACNSFGGVTYLEKNMVEDTERIIVLDGRGMIRQEFTGKELYYNKGNINADVVVKYNYREAYWRARNIATRGARYSWNNIIQAEECLISYADPLRIVNINSHYGTFKTLMIQEFKEGIEVERFLYVDLLTGNPIRIKSETDTDFGIRTTDILYNYLDIEEKSIIRNAFDEIIYTTKSAMAVEGQGRPAVVYNAEGKVLRGRLLKSISYLRKGVTMESIQNLTNGLPEYAVLHPDMLGEGVTWWITINYDRCEIEETTQTMAYKVKVTEKVTTAGGEGYEIYRRGERIEEVKHTKTLGAGEGKLYKKETFASGLEVTYEQDAITGLTNDIKMRVETATDEFHVWIHTWTSKITYDQLEMEESRIMYADGDISKIVMKANRKGKINKTGKEITLGFTRANGESGIMVVDLITGLTKTIEIDVETATNESHKWTTKIAYDALGVEKGRKTYADGDEESKLV